MWTPSPGLNREIDYLPRNGIIIQARLGSTRLPGKVLLDLGGQPMLSRQFERLRLVRNVDDIVVATSDNPIDDPIANLAAQSSGIKVWRGPEDDVLARFAGAATEFDLDIIGRVTGDCPFIDPDVISTVLDEFMATPDCDYASNCRPRSWPFGFDVEFVSRRALLAADAEASDPFDREHVLVYIFTQPERFCCVNVVDNSNHEWQDLRLAVDYAEDLDMSRALFETLQEKWPAVSTEEIRQVVRDNPELLAVNADVPAHESISDASQRGQRRAPLPVNGGAG